MHVPSLKIVEYLKPLKINFPNSNLDTSGTLEIPVRGGLKGLALLQD